MKDQLQTQIRTAPVENCPMCGGRPAAILTDCVDYVSGLPGRWRFCQCQTCRSLWLNPAPGQDQIGLLYPSTYTFTRSHPDLSEGNSFAGQLKRAALGRLYGYQNLRPSQGASLINFFAGWLCLFPAVSQRAGHSVRYLHARPAGRILDAGCGNGSFVLFMQKLGWQAEGIEPDEKAASMARRHGARVQVCDLLNARLEPESFDAITLTHVAEHLAEPRSVFERLVRSLKVGGVLVSISPNPEGFLRRRFGNKWYELDPPRHLVIPSAAGYTRLLESLGLSVRTWTSMRLFYWARKESMSIARVGRVGAVADSLTLRASSAALKLVLSIFGRRAGEEVVCYAVKSGSLSAER